MRNWGKRGEEMFRTIGESLSVHPEMVRRVKESFARKRESLLSHPKVIAWMEKEGLNREEVLFSLSEILHWVTEEEHCGACPGYEACPNMFRGYCSKPHMEEGRLYFLYHPCKLQLKHEQEERQRRLFHSHLIPQEMRSVHFKDLEMDEGNGKAIRAAVLFCRQFKEMGARGLYLYGEFGVGKSYLMAAIANCLVEDGHSVYFIHVPTFFRDVKQSLSDQTFAEKMVELENIDCLILDDIGAENFTPWLRDEVLGPLLQYRTQNGKPTLYTSNLNYEQLAEHMALSVKGEMDEMKSLRIMERIRSYTDAYLMLGGNRRRREHL